MPVENTDHPFAQYLKIIGKGPNMSRPLSQAEACEAMTMIAAGDVQPEHLGAFLLLLRYRGETAEEIAGFVEASRARITLAAPKQPVIDFDWPSYADRHRQQPWFVLAAKTLAEQGYKVLMHGIAGQSEGYAPTRPVLRTMGVPFASSLDHASGLFSDHNLVYIGLENYLPAIESLFGLRHVLGVRTVVNTFARVINPLGARCQLQGVVHPPYRDTHQQVAVLLNQPHAAVFKGGGGEVQCNPLKPCRVQWTNNAEAGEDVWPAALSNTQFDWRAETLCPGHVVDLWLGDISIVPVEEAIISTIAIALKTAGICHEVSSAMSTARDMWMARSKTINRET